MVVAARPPVLAGPGPPAAAGLAGLAAAVALIGALHVLVPVPGPAFAMLSEFALGPYGALFAGAVLALAAGSGGVLAALRRAGHARLRAPAGRLLALWCVALALVAAVPTGVAAAPPTAGAVVHAVAGATAFLALPVAGLAVGRGIGGRAGLLVRALAGLALVLVVPVLLGLAPGSPVAVQEVSGVPFGLLQRGLLAVDTALLAVLAMVALRAPGGGTAGPQA